MSWARHRAHREFEIFPPAPNAGAGSKNSAISPGIVRLKPYQDRCVAKIGLAHTFSNSQEYFISTGLNNCTSDPNLMLDFDIGFW